MNIRNVISIALLCLCLVPFTTQARSPVPIINHENVSITTGSGARLTPEQVKTAFLNAGRLRKWTLTETAPNQLVGQLHVRNKHTIMIDINYTGEQYSVTYKDSINMKYGMKEMEDSDTAVPVIHPFYNNWVNELLDSVRMELSRY